MSEAAQLVLRDDPSKVAPLQRSRPTTIGRAESNRLRLATLDGVSDHHAVVRFSLSQGWLVCDWQSSDGTFLEGERIRQCRRLHDGDEIQLGPAGPVLVFRLRAGVAVSGEPELSTAEATLDRSRPGRSLASGQGGASRGPQASPSASVHPAAPRSPAPPRATPGPGPGAAAAPGGRPAGAAAAATGSPGAQASPPASGATAAGSTLTISGRTIPLEQIRSAHVRSRARHPNSFSWWVLVCLGGMVLLPFPWLFWGLEIAALAAWILLGSRKQHELLITLRDGMAHRYVFTNRVTALSHRNGIRKAIGQSLEAA